MRRNIALRFALIPLSLAIAAVFLLALNSCDDERNIAPEIVEETTGEPEYTRSLYGAAAQFPQGTNPPIGVERTDAVSSDARIFLEDAERNGENITAFGRFTGGVPECVLLGGSGTASEGEMEVAGDTFLFTAMAGDSGGDYAVRCTIGNRFFADDAPVEEITIKSP